MGDREIQQAQALAQIRQQSEETIRQLTAQRNASLAINPKADTSALDAEITAERNALQQRLANQKQYYSEVTAMQSDWMAGLTASWQNYIDQGKDVAGMTANVFTDAFSGMENSMVNFV
jgi:lambda family phage tail tape measure protein